ncbi:hypothetical protein DDB_G0269928 [Dictyostelium discoideum AX4]|uniref:Uncharacterized protein n=1 Tax=Dictyostelium discoideum TaxID=44689 RepID=Q55CS0_DICDI|nr:hypothetical protein DDB_G0269928 [Dictyostelium discoideum AX4]EAL72314.1 hypothetical protein DDB_G0269928 [Dictyostelium discoideum AX4]|eukprot:XP_646411.1 hypothetical protein DDB_G0269928 [Dictyostelium discoideum AX4]
MKVILSLLLLTLSVATVLSTSYVNFIPYEKGSNCNGGNSHVRGVGYSVPVDSCITFDFFRNWKFSLSSDSSSVKYSYFANGTSSHLDCSEPQGETMVVSNGECIETIGEHYFDGYFAPKQAHSYLVTISNTPSYPKFSWVNSFTHGSGCSTNDIVFASFATNYTAIDTEDQEIVYCNVYKETYTRSCGVYNGMPYCSNEFFNYVCITEQPFLQSSEEEEKVKNPVGFYKTSTCMGDL